MKEAKRLSKKKIKVGYILRGLSDNTFRAKVEIIDETISGKYVLEPFGKKRFFCRKVFLMEKVDVLDIHSEDTKQDESDIYSFAGIHIRDRTNKKEVK